MSAVSRIWTAIVVAGIGTYAMRAAFLVFAHRLVDVPPGVQRLLRQIPPAALAAIVLPALMRPEGQVDVMQARFAAGVAAAVIAWRTRNIALTLGVGIGLVMVVDAL